MTGLDLFRKRTQKQELDEAAIFSKYGITLPPLAKDFLSEHELDMSLASSNHFFHKAILNQGDISFPFSSIEMMLQSTATDDEIISKGLMLFAANQHGIYIGTSGEWSDKIVTPAWSVENSLVIVEDDIIQFLKNTHSRLIDITDDENEFVSFLRQMDYDEEEINYELERFRVFKNSR